MAGLTVDRLLPGINNALNGMIIDAVAATQGVDKSAERLIIENCDLSSVDAGEAVWVWEHKDGDQSTPLDVIGIVRSAKKIYSEADCATDRERYWWDQVRQPLIYVIIRLYDGAGHPGALAVAAQIRDHYANGEKIVVRNSIHGSTLERNGQELSATVFRKLASTLTPCNNSCDTGLLDDPTLRQMGIPIEKREGVVSSCAMAIECLPGRGLLLADPPKPIPADEAAARAALAVRARDQLAGVTKSERAFPQLAKYHRHDGRSAAGLVAHDPVRASDRHAEAWREASREVADLHGRAIEGWRRARERLLGGDVSRRAVEHAVLVSGLKPGGDGSFLRKADRPEDRALSGVHEAVLRHRGGPELLRELGGDPRAELLLAHLGYSEYVPMDRALAQHRFGCDEIAAHGLLAEHPEWLAGWDHGDCCSISAPLPAAWLHWLAAPRYARTVGLPVVGGDRAGLLEASMPPNGGPWPAEQTAALERSWSRRFGDLGASLLYFAAISPTGA